MTFKENIENEKKKWKNMNGKQRLSYFKSYYLVPLIVAIVIIAVVVDILLQTVILKKDIIMSGIVFNHELSDEAIEAFEHDYIEFVDANPKKEQAGISFNPVSEEDYTSLMVVQTSVGARTLDFVIVDKMAYEVLNGSMFYANLEEVIDSDRLSQVEDKILTTKDVETGEEYKAAIDISDTSFAKKYLSGKDMYLVFVVNSTHIEDMPKLFDYFMQK